MGATEERLFTPGTGATPPTLAGREREQEVLSLRFADLTVSRSPPHDLVLIGPRGNGKTALLNWFERTCHESAANVGVAAIAADCLERRHSLPDAARSRSGQPLVPKN